MRTLILGGSRGIGAALVRRLRGRGDTVAFSYYRSRNRAEALAEETGAAALYCDAGDPASVAAFYGAARSAMGGVEGAVLNAGEACFALLQEMTDEQWRRVMAINLDAAFYLARACLPAMISEKSGSIVFVSSMWGQVGASCEAAYSAAKAGLIGLTRALAKEVGPSGVRVNCVAPGVIDTDMNAGLTAQARRALAEETPLGRLGRADECAAAIAGLLGGEASFITGQVLGVNGGFVV